MREVAVAVRDRPIPFQGPMVCGLLREEDPKTQTRRAMSRQKQYDFTDYTLFGQQGHSDSDWVAIEHAPDWPDGKDDQCHCPYARRRGDRLWVREAWRVSNKHDSVKPADLPHARGLTVMYEAGGSLAHDDRGVYVHSPEYPQERPTWAGRYRPPMFMPRWASRILLEVTEVRVQRLQEISREDALAEGIVQLADGGFGLPAGEFYHAADPRQSYFALWESINGAGAVEANPWVWAVSFNRIKP